MSYETIKMSDPELYGAMKRNLSVSATTSS